MLDARLRLLIDPPLNRAGAWLAAYGVKANAVTATGIVVGLLAAGMIYRAEYGLAILFILVGRFLDGLDGAVARATAKSAFGGYFDIVADFIFYVSVPVAFGLAQPANLVPALTLVATFALTGVSFLAFAAVAAEEGLASVDRGEKSFFYSVGIAEGAETILVFLLMCLFPNHFAFLAFAFAALCGLTVLQRSLMAWRLLGGRHSGGG